MHRNQVKDRAAFDSQNVVEFFRPINGTQASGVEDVSCRRRSCKKHGRKKDTNHRHHYQQV